MILDVVRHGESEFNLQGRYAGSTDTALTPQGRQQAAELAEALRGEVYDLIVTSPLQRARDTAEAVHAGRDVPLVVMEEFAERCVGVFEGLTRDEAARQYPELWKANSLGKLDTAPPGAESMLQVSARLEAGLARLRKEYPVERVLLVCHGFVARELNRRFSNLTYEEMSQFSLGNCEVVRFRWE